MANIGRPRSVATTAESSKKNASKQQQLQLSKPTTRLPITSGSATGSRGRDNFGLIVGVETGVAAAGAAAGLKSCQVTTCSPLTETAPLRPTPISSRLMDSDRASMRHGPCNPGRPLRIEDGLARTGKLWGIAEAPQGLVKQSEHLAVESTCTGKKGALSSAAISVEAGGRKVRPKHDSPVAVSKSGSTTALETLMSCRSDSPIYEELDFRCASFRDLNSNFGSQRSPDASDSSSELSLISSRSGQSYALRPMEPGVPFPRPSCGVRIARMRASRKQDGVRPLPPCHSMTHVPSPSCCSSVKGNSSDCSSSLSSGQCSPKDRRHETEVEQDVAWRDNHRSSLDLNVTYVEYFEETISKEATGVSCRHQQQQQQKHHPVSASSRTASPCNSTTSLQESNPISPCSAATSSSSASLSCSSSSLALQQSQAKDVRRKAMMVTTTKARPSLGANREAVSGGTRRLPLSNTNSSAKTVVKKDERTRKNQIRTTALGVSGNKGTTSFLPAKGQPRIDCNRQDSTKSLPAAAHPGVEGRELKPIMDPSTRSQSLTIKRSFSEPEDSSECSGSITSSPNSTNTLRDSIQSEMEDTTIDDLVSSEFGAYEVTASDGAPGLEPGAARETTGKEASRGDISQCPSIQRLQGVHQRQLIKTGIRKCNSSLEVKTLGSSASSFAHKQTTVQSPSIILTASRKATTSGIQRIENFGQTSEMSARRASAAAALQHPVKLGKSTSSSDLNRNTQTMTGWNSAAMRLSGSHMTTSQVDSENAQIRQNSRLKIPASPTSAKSPGLQRTPCSESETGPEYNHSQISAKQLRLNKAGCKSASRKDTGGILQRNDDYHKDVKNAIPPAGSSQRFAPSQFASSNKLAKENVVSPSTGGVTKQPTVHCSSKIPGAGDSSSATYHPLSPISEKCRHPPRASVLPGNTTRSETKIPKGQMSPPVLPLTNAKSAATPLLRSLSATQRATSMSKIPSGKSVSPVTVCKSTNPETQRSAIIEAAAHSKLPENNLLKSSEVSQSHSNIFDRSVRGESSPPSPETPLPTALGSCKLNASSCNALNDSKDSHKSISARREGVPNCNMIGASNSDSPTTAFAKQGAIGTDRNNLMLETGAERTRASSPAAIGDAEGSDTTLLTSSKGCSSSPKKKKVPTATLR